MLRFVGSQKLNVVIVNVNRGVNVLFHSNLLIKFRRSLRSRLIVTVVIVQNK